MNHSYLLDNEAMKNRSDIPSWVSQEFENFSNVVLEKTFPCYFGLTALKKNELRYSFLSHDDWSHLPNTMLSFLQLMQERPIVRRGFFLFVEPEREEQSLEHYRTYFWKVLQYLHEQDSQPWPKQIPENPDHYLWEFSFGGEPMFAFGNAPAYKQRKTRHLGNSLVIGFQPRIIFDGLEGDRPKGAYSRQMVRERVEKWDQLPKHPNISHYGDPNHREWKQYFIGDDIEPIRGKCPFHHIIEK
ncbi:YqcI/YcgG family protein [Bacillus sp. DX1.1]|uniref:YqcI/YcgG family protein n=1 Tax=unclassified Bacillus (in: firmicutes) TaxID=185979 RepID=UPI0025703662|nr:MULTISPECIES: YqcI/YcgG family protein [unclassified Bacillus (in: firmicutes)]MDM5154231.1 YqcI/YcgG family protein [Bacillus sp. DX1.1]WJE83151.1 YqcI/YcgG family protein [Bacillus sp. DX3.1]